MSTSARDGDAGVCAAGEVTEPKPGAGASHHAAASLSALIESTEDLIWSVDPNYRLLTFNKALRDHIERNFGVRAEVGMGPYELLTPERAALWPPLYDRAFSQGPFRVEFPLSDGRTLELSFNPILAVDRIAAVSVFGKDIAERKTAERRLLEAENKYRDIFEGAIEGIFQNTFEGRSLAANPALARMLGYESPQDFLTTVTDVARQVWMDPDERSRFLRLIVDREVVRGYECRFKRKDGTPLWVSANGRNVRAEDGQLLYVEGFIEDITERKRMQDALRKSEAKFAKAFLNSPAIMTLTEIATSRLVEVNNAFEQLTGYPREEAIGRTANELGLWLDPAEREESVRQFREVGRLSNFERRFRTKAGEIRIGLTSAEPLELPGGQYAISATVDITERREAEAEKAALEAQLAQSQKAESIGRLAGGVAHDFNNLLTVINGYSNMLLAKLKVGDPLRDSIGEIHKAGERAAGLTRQLLAFSRKQILEPRTLEINRVVEDMRPMLERLMGEDVEVRVALHAKGGTIHADPHQLEQVMMNLVVNARDAMPGSGKLLIETADVERDESYARSHPEARAGRYAMLAVSDTGVGMDEETKNRIFEPFFTTKEMGKGTGLGLSMVQGIVAQSGGYVEVHSEKGMGTTFKIYLPALTEAAAEAGGEAAVPVAGGKETVLVVEDQAEVRQYAVAALKTYGYRAISVENGGEALLVCQRERIDLVLTDVVMPNLSGQELAERLEKLQPGVKVLFMSGYTDRVVEPHGALEEGANFIQKPFSADDLAAKVRAALGAPAPAARILVADDEAGVRSFLRRVLEDGGYEVMEAADGKQALQQALAGRVNLVITDLVMPEQEGIETIRALRREAPDIGIIAISGAFEGQFLKAAKALGADAVMDKPVNADLLLARVAEVLTTRR